MANKRIGIMDIRQIIRLYSQGNGKRFISRQLGISRNTVETYIAGFLGHDLTWQDVEKMSDHELIKLIEGPAPEPVPRQIGLDEEFKVLEKALGRPGQTRQAYWLDYITRKPDGYSLSQFCDLFRRWRKQTKPTLSIDHKAGDKLFIDYAGKKLSYVDPQTGEVVYAEVFLATLGFSQMTYVEASLSQKKEELVRCLENALLFFGGVPQAVVPDNLKSAVKKARRYEPEINETFQDLALHYGMHVLPARVRKPQDKALVEIAVKLVYQRIYSQLHDQVFNSLDELNTAIWVLLEIYNRKHFAGRDYSRFDVFGEVEKQYLAPLPLERHEIRRYYVGTVHKNCHVLLPGDQHYYSVPHEKVGEKVKLKYTQDEVWIYHHYEQIAYHKRDRSKYGKTTITEHLTKAHQGYVLRGAEEYLVRAQEIGEYTFRLIEKVLDRTKYLEHNYQSCQGILQLRKKVGSERLDLACRRALDYGVYNYKMVLSILEKGLEQPGEETKVIRLPGHNNIRGNKYYK
ncbi:MAG: IS21 family transposase [Bacteroidetes bacterium]|jgi:transposase|nr:IS21 family transposase [Bacteroidota bacterium]